MALSEGQQQTLAQIGQASYKRASAEYEGDQPPVQPSTPEQQESGEYDPRQETGTGVDLTQPKQFDEEGYEQSLREHGFTNRANERAASKVALEKEQLEFKVKDQQHKTETMLLGAQMMQAGFKDQGMATFNTSLPKGQKLLDFKEIGGNKARVFTEDKPDGFITSVDGMITMLTDANVQYGARMAAIQQKYKSQGEKKLKANEHRQPDGKIVTTSEIRAAHRMEYGLASDDDLFMMKQVNPKQYSIEKAKIGSAPSVFQFSQKSYGIDLQGGARDPSVPKGVKESQHKIDVAMKVPPPAQKLTRGEQTTVEGVLYRRNSETGMIEIGRTKTK